MACCGDDDGAKEVAATLVSDVGFEPVDAGPLRIARYLEAFALLMASSRTRAMAVPRSRTDSNDSRSRSQRGGT
jgi:predicted dinucleotide-binding enzyme